MLVKTLNLDMSDTSQLESLGSGKVVIYDEPNVDILETFANLHEDNIYLVPFVQARDEFRSICPKTKQPDVGKVEIIYVPDKRLVESKALKLYLNSFANHGSFHEDCMNIIAKDLCESMNSPKYLRVYIDYASRGSLAIKPLVEIWGDCTAEENEQIKRLVNTWDIKK